MFLPISMYFSFQWLESLPARRLVMQTAGIILLPVAALLWLLPYRLACFNMRAFGHLCLEPFFLHIDETVNARIFGLRNRAIANQALLEFLQSRYPIIQSRPVVNILAAIYSWRFLQVDVGRYLYCRNGGSPDYPETLARYGHGVAATRYREDFVRFLAEHVPSAELAGFVRSHASGYAVVHWRVEASNSLHNIRNSFGSDLVDSIAFIRGQGYGVCIGGGGYDNDPAFERILAMDGVWAPSRSTGYSAKDDLWMLAHATFGVYGDSGIATVAALLDKPALIHNRVASALPHFDLRRNFCVKKMVWRESRDLVSDEDLLRLNLSTYADGNLCDANGIVAVDCPADEITAGVRALVEEIKSKTSP